MESFKQATSRWGGFGAAVVRYMLLASLTVLATWLMEIGKEGFQQAVGYDFIKVGVGMAIAALNAIGALQNSSYQEAKDSQPTNNKLTLE